MTGALETSRDRRNGGQVLMSHAKQNRSGAGM